MKYHIILSITIIIALSISTSSSGMDTTQEKMTAKHFQEFLTEINKTPAEEKQNLADDFIENVKKTGYPILENDSTAVLLYKGSEDSVFLLGDMTDWSYFLPLEKIMGTDLFYYRGKYEPAARLEYWFTFSPDGFPITDPLNKYKSLNGLGELSVLAMPGYARHPFFTEYEEGKKGSFNDLVEYEIPSEYLGYSHTIHIYLPPGYNKENNYNYPAVYFQDGKDYIQYALAPHILNELIRSEKIKPVIAVFVTPPNLHQPKIPNRMTEYGMNDDYVKFFSEELVTFINEKYSASGDPKDRLVAGDSYGGLISAYIAFCQPEIFQNAYSQSGYHSFSKDKFIKMIDSSERKPINLFIDTGTYERKVGASFLPEEEADFLEGNRRLKKSLEEKKYKFIYKEYYEGHTWGSWRRHLIDALIYFFGREVL